LIDTVGRVAELPAANATGFCGWSSIVRSLVVSQTLTVWAVAGATTAISIETRVADIEKAFLPGMSAMIPVCREYSREGNCFAG
jgi:hypothetical protein